MAGTPAELVAVLQPPHLLSRLSLKDVPPGRSELQLRLAQVDPL